MRTLHAALIFAVAGCTDDASPTGPVLHLETTELALGPEMCGIGAVAYIALENTGDAPLSITLSSTIDDLEIPSAVTVEPGHGEAIRVASKLRLPPNQPVAGVVVVHATGVDYPIPVTLESRGMAVTMTPSALDFGRVLVNTTHERSVTFASSAPSWVDLTLAVPSDPHFEIVGASVARVGAGNNPMVSIRLIANGNPQVHDASLPLQVPTGVCLPERLRLVAESVP